MSTYERYRKNEAELRKAEANFKDAERILAGAAEERQKAEEILRLILEETEKEVTPELIREAWEEYKQILHGQAAVAAQKEDFKLAAGIYSMLERMKATYETEEVFSQDNDGDIEKRVNLWLDGKGIADTQQRTHCINRAKLLVKAEMPADEIFKMLGAGLKVRARIAKPPFTGWQKQ